MDESVDKSINDELNTEAQFEKLAKSQCLDDSLKFLNDIYDWMMETGDTRTALLSQTIIIEYQRFGWPPSQFKLNELRLALTHRHWKKSTLES